jgi:hypothetical protein
VCAARSSVLSDKEKPGLFLTLICSKLDNGDYISSGAFVLLKN